MASNFRTSNSIADISFAGGSFSIDGRMCRCFLDTGYPIQVEELTTGEVVTDVNGGIAFGLRPGFAKVSVCVAYGSTDDAFLRRKFEQMQTNLLVKTPEAYRISVQDGVGNSAEFKKAYPVSYMGMPSVAGDGRIQAVRYTFIATNCGE